MNIYVLRLTSTGTFYSRKGAAKTFPFSQLRRRRTLCNRKKRRMQKYKELRVDMGKKNCAKVPTRNVNFYRSLHDKYVTLAFNDVTTKCTAKITNLYYHVGNFLFFLLLTQFYYCRVQRPPRTYFLRRKKCFRMNIYEYVACQRSRYFYFHSCLLTVELYRVLEILLLEKLTRFRSDCIMNRYFIILVENLL